jgi:C_GCAxxG_C_C family probable redox protein
VKEQRQEILERAFETGKNYETKNGGCPQCTLAAIFDVLGIENDAVFKAAAALADGVGLTGDGHCGALSGGTMAIGYLYGREKKDFTDIMKLVPSNLMAKELRDRFVEKYGTVRCHDLQNKFFGRFYNLYDPAELEAAFKGGMLDTCSTVVGEVARMTVDIILTAQEAAEPHSERIPR